MKGSDATASTLIRIGIYLDVLMATIGLVGFVVAVTLLYPAYPWVDRIHWYVSVYRFSYVLYLPVLFAVTSIAGVFWLLVNYLAIYRRMDFSPHVRASAFAIGILETVFGGFPSGILVVAGAMAMSPPSGFSSSLHDTPLRDRERIITDLKIVPGAVPSETGPVRGYQQAIVTVVLLIAAFIGFTFLFHPLPFLSTLNLVIFLIPGTGIGLSLVGFLFPLFLSLLCTGIYLWCKVKGLGFYNLYVPLLILATYVTYAVPSLSLLVFGGYSLIGSRIMVLPLFATVSFLIALMAGGRLKSAALLSFPSVFLTTSLSDVIGTMEAHRLPIYMQPRLMVWGGAALYDGDFLLPLALSAIFLFGYVHSSWWMEKHNGDMWYGLPFHSDPEKGFMHWKALRSGLRSHRHPPEITDATIGAATAEGVHAAEQAKPCLKSEAASEATPESKPKAESGTREEAKDGTTTGNSVSGENAGSPGTPVQDHPGQDKTNVSNVQDAHDVKNATSPQAPEGKAERKADGSSDADAENEQANGAWIGSEGEGYDPSP